MPKAKGSKYVVAKGRQTGIFDSYKDQVRPSTDGHPSNIHQKFRSQEAAEKAYNKLGGPNSQEGPQWAVKKGHQPGFYPDWIQAAPNVLGYPHNEHRRFDDYESAKKWMEEEDDNHGSSSGYPCGKSLRDADFTESYTEARTGYASYIEDDQDHSTSGSSTGSHKYDTYQPTNGDLGDYGHEEGYDDAQYYDGDDDDDQYDDGGDYDDDDDDYGYGF
ncbi:hypothetical protein TWF696_008541 [Orbilia brochopaga]|uniref:Ribonuclease H1 N-terminal domain-containing protein n=1 Tax=Orbilia brochopaga TaxID=3140254 RepID=A0AAV9UFZ6_9PEZI